MDRSRLEIIAILSVCMIPALTVAVLEAPAGARLDEAMLVCVLIAVSGLSTAGLMWTWRKLDLALPMSAKGRGVMTWLLILGGVLLGTFALSRYLLWAAEILAVATGFGMAIALMAGRRVSQ